MASVNSDALGPFTPVDPLRPENDTNASSRQDKENKTGDFLKNAPFNLQFILTATEAAIPTQKPNGKLDAAC